MLINRKALIAISLSAIVTVVALTSMAPDDDMPKNLKVLPKHTTEMQIHKIMREWAISLGVRCNFCHAAATDGKGLDFASDAKPEKNMARNMYKMAAKINNKYFEGKKDSLGMVIGDIKCITCHHGSPHPDEVKGMDMDHDHDMKGPGNGQQAPPPPPAPPAGN